MDLLDALQYGFMQRALVAGIFIGLLCSVLGVFLVLRRLSLLGDGLAHATFGSVALALVLGTQPLFFSIPVVMACALGIQRLMERVRLYGDAAIGIVSAAGIAVAVLLASASGGFNVDLFSYLFGSILSISPDEVLAAVALAAAVLAVVALCYADLLAITFDEDTARASGIPVRRLNTVFILLTAVTVVLSMKLVGIMLVSALLILPAVTAFQVARSFRATLALAAVSAVVSVAVGILAAFVWDLPAGATIVLMNLALFMAALAWRRLGGGS